MHSQAVGMQKLSWFSRTSPSAILCEVRLYIHERPPGETFNYVIFVWSYIQNDFSTSLMVKLFNCVKCLHFSILKKIKDVVYFRFSNFQVLITFFFSSWQALNQQMVIAISHARISSHITYAINVDLGLDLRAWNFCFIGSSQALHSPVRTIYGH